MGTPSEAIKKARMLLKKGEFKGAVALLLKENETDEAVRVLAGKRQYKAAAKVLIDAIGIPLKNFDTLDSKNGKYASLAASLYAKADDCDKAVKILMAMGKKEKAVELLQRSGKSIEAAQLQGSTVGDSKRSGGADLLAQTFGSTAITEEIAQRLEENKKYQLALEAYLQLRKRGDAARMARELGLLEQAADLYAEGGMPFEAAVCYMKLKNRDKCLENLVRVPRDHPKYRLACHNVVKLATNMGDISFQTEHVLSAFVDTGPENEKELPVFYALGMLYQQKKLYENCTEAFTKIEEFSPGYKDVAKRLKKIEELDKESFKDFQNVIQEDSDFGSMVSRREDIEEEALPGLPGLPDLPDLPPVPTAEELAAAMGSQAGMSTQISPTTSGGGQGGPAPSHEELFTQGGIIADRYRIEKKVGQGGMAMVFKAQDMELDELVALKVFIRPIDDEETLERFKQELRLSRKLSHPNIIRLHDIGVYLGHRYLSMEFLVGRDLQDFMGEAMPLEIGLDFLIQVCNGLEVAHKKGVIHRDMKPPNVFITDDNIAKVMDFGIAKNQDTHGLTQAGLIFGTPQYMSPEQINDPRTVGPATDLYAMGVMAYQMFTGTLPFNHPELVTLLMMQANQPPEPPKRRNDKIPQELEDIIMNLLEKNPKNRFKNCKAVAKKLEAIQSQLLGS